MGQPDGFIRWLCGEAERSRDNQRMKAKPDSRRHYGGERSLRHNGAHQPQREAQRSVVGWMHGLGRRSRVCALAITYPFLNSLHLH